MRGRPKKENSRDKQYRVRLNDDEDGMLSYASGVTGKQKSEIFRQALVDYYNNLRVKEYNSDEMEWEPEGISLVRIIDCPYCGTGNQIDFEEDCDSWSEERQMGPEITYSFNWEECDCEACGQSFRVSGYICEYPVGMYNYEDIKVEKNEEEN